jgi:hypothetical protein
MSNTDERCVQRTVGDSGGVSMHANTIKAMLGARVKLVTFLYKFY